MDNTGCKSCAKTEPTDGPRRDTLLVVDDEPGICRNMARLLGGCFDCVHTATSQSEAERVLREERITHLICDYNLGETKSEISILPGVDRVFFKPGDLPELIATFSLRE